MTSPHQTIAARRPWPDAYYGIAVNLPPWDFGKLLGVYVSLFFLTAQVINFVVYDVHPDMPILAGGAMIVIGGLIITFWRA